MTVLPGNTKYHYGDTVTLPLADSLNVEDVAGKAVTFDSNGDVVLAENADDLLVGTAQDINVGDASTATEEGDHVAVQIAGLPVVVEASDDTPVAGDYLEPVTGGEYGVVSDPSVVDALEGRPFVLGEESAINTNPRPRSNVADRNLYVAVFR